MSELRQAAAAIRADITRGRWLGFEWTMGQVAVWLDACALVVEVSDSASKSHAHEVARAYLSEAG